MPLNSINPSNIISHHFTMSDTNKPKFYRTKEFKELRKKWYKKLDEDFNDIERTGRLKASGYYDEYNSILPNADSNVRARYTLASYQFYSHLRFFSYVTRVVPNHGSYASNFVNKHTKYIKLLSTDRIILRKYGNGGKEGTIASISTYLRRRCKPPKSKSGPKGLPYSVYYVHSRLKYLISLMNSSTYDGSNTLCNSHANLDIHGGVSKKGF